MFTGYSRNSYACVSLCAVEPMYGMIVFVPAQSYLEMAPKRAPSAAVQPTAKRRVGAVSEAHRDSHDLL